LKDLKVKFTKNRYYQKKLFKSGDIVNMPKRFANAYARSSAIIILKEKPVLKSPIKKGNTFISLNDVDEKNPEIMDMPKEVNVTPLNDVEIEYENLSYREIQIIATEKGLPARGKKEDLIARLKLGG
jgi:hypothetical protein